MLDNGDLISRSELIEALEGELAICGLSVRMRMHLAGIIDSMPSYERAGEETDDDDTKTTSWILTRQELPPEDQWVLVTEAGTDEVKLATWTPEDGWTTEHGQLIGIVAWMPLPEPWKG